MRNLTPLEELAAEIEAAGLDELIQPKEVKTELRGFIPVFQQVLDQYADPIRGLVHGAAASYCRMEDGVCRASLSRIGARIGVDKSTVQRHMEALCADGYFVDLTPDLKNRPHIYADTGKVSLKGIFEARVAQNNAGVAQNNAGVAQSRLNKDSNTESKRLTPEEIEQAGNLVTLQLQGGKLQTYTNRNKFPEVYLPFCDVFVTLTGLKPGKKDVNDWMASFSDWLNEGLTPADIANAYAYATRPDGGFLVSRPGSLTNTAKALKAQNSRQPANPVRVVRAEEQERPKVLPDFVREHAAARGIGGLNQ